VVIAQALAREARVIYVQRPQAPLEDTLVRLMRHSTDQGGAA